MRSNYSIKIPMLRAVPAIIDIAASVEAAFRSGFFNSAISRTWSEDTTPMWSLLGTPDPLGCPAARKSSTAAGGVLVINENVRSAYTVMITGMINPAGLGSGH